MAKDEYIANLLLLSKSSRSNLNLYDLYDVIMYDVIMFKMLFPEK